MKYKGLDVEKLTLGDWENGRIPTDFPKNIYVPTHHVDHIKGAEKYYYQFLSSKQSQLIQKAARKLHEEKIKKNLETLKNQLNTWLANTPNRKKTLQDEIDIYETLLGIKKFNNRDEEERAIKNLALKNFFLRPMSLGGIREVYQNLIKAKNHYKVEGYQLTDHMAQKKDYYWIIVKGILGYLEHLEKLKSESQEFVVEEKKEFKSNYDIGKKSKNQLPSLLAIALYHFYRNEPIDRYNSTEISQKYGWPGSGKLASEYSTYKILSARTADEVHKRRNNNKIEAFKWAISHLEGDQKIQAEDEYKTFLTKIGKLTDSNDKE